MPAVRCAVLCLIAATVAAQLTTPPVMARGRWSERIAERRTAPVSPENLPANVRVLRDRHYGDDPRQCYDVYAPVQAKNAPTLFLVHGGGWKRGDKAAGNVVTAKVARWTAQGFVVISTNYRMLPDADPLTQASDVATAVAAAQRDSTHWGGDAKRFVLIGHSAGAHLSALLTTSPALLAQAGARPVLGGVLLDSAMLDAETLMAAPHMRLYDDAFGSDPRYWRAVSPYRQLSATGVPVLAVCSSRRGDSCKQAHRYIAQARTLGRRAQVLEQDLSHEQINAELGRSSAYTQAVETFLRSLDPVLARAL